MLKNSVFYIILKLHKHYRWVFSILEDNILLVDWTECAVVITRTRTSES